MAETTLCEVCQRPMVDVDVWLEQDNGETCCGLAIARERCWEIGYARERAGRETAERERDGARKAREVVLAEARRLAGGWQHKAEKHLHQKRVAEEQRDAAEARAVAAEAALAEARAEAQRLRGLLGETVETLNCGEPDKNNDNWNSGHWCAACDDTVDRNMVLRRRIDAALATPAAEAEKERKP